MVGGPTTDAAATIVDEQGEAFLSAKILDKYAPIYTVLFLKKLFLP